MVGNPNVVVCGWWPRWRLSPRSGDGLGVYLDGEEVASLHGYGSRIWRGRLVPGRHAITLVDLGPRPSTVVDATVVVPAAGAANIVFRATYISLLAGRRWREAWLTIDSKPVRPTWFAPSPDLAAELLSAPPPEGWMDRARRWSD